MNEIMPSMRVIKMYTWEKPFAKLVEIARRREVAKIKVTSLLRGVNMALFFVSAKIIVFLCFVVFILTDGKITAQIVFVSIALFNNCRQSLTLFFQEFLLLEEKELESDHIDNKKEINNSDDAGVWLNEMTASWASSQHSEPTLKDITFGVTPGQLIVIVGKQINHLIVRHFKDISICLFIQRFGRFGKKFYSDECIVRNTDYFGSDESERESSLCQV